MNPKRKIRPSRPLSKRGRAKVGARHPAQVGTAKGAAGSPPPNRVLLLGSASSCRVQGAKDPGLHAHRPRPGRQPPSSRRHGRTALGSDRGPPFLSVGWCSPKDASRVRCLFSCEYHSCEYHLLRSMNPDSVGWQGRRSAADRSSALLSVNDAQDGSGLEDGTPQQFTTCF